MWTLTLMWACATTQSLDTQPYAGRFDDVTFTTDEAAMLLDFVNHASFRTLDDEVGLDHRAVESIVHHRPVRNLLQLSDTPYVGEVGMTRLKDFALGESVLVELD